MTNTPNRINGAALRAIRERSGLSLTGLAGLVNERRANNPIPGSPVTPVHAGSLRNIELNRRGAGPTILAELAAALAVPQTALLADGGRPATEAQALAS